MVNQIFAYTACALLATGAAQAQTIKKCQDAHGNWHYGDYAAQECERSRVTEIDDRGLRVGEQKPPPTAEEVQARRASKARAEEEKVEQAKQRQLDRRLLSTYESEQSIKRALDERLVAIDRALNADRSVKKQLEDELASLQKRSGENTSPEIESFREQIADYERVIDKKMRQRDSVVVRFDDDLERYRELMKRSRAAQVD